MKREDFKEITEEHIKVVKKIVKGNGCSKIKCEICPFTLHNVVNNKGCASNYGNSEVQMAKQFLELFNKPEEKSLNFYEKLSAILYGKQILFKQDDGTYYNRQIEDIMSKKEAKECLLAEVGELKK